MPQVCLTPKVGMVPNGVGEGASLRAKRRARAEHGAIWHASFVTDFAAVVREAQAGDHDGIWPLTRSFAMSFTVSREAFDDAFDLLVSDEGALMLVAEEPALGMVGYQLANRHLTLFANGQVAWVEEVMVDDRVRRTGVGRELMARAEEWATTAGAAYIALATRRADQFYKALGYEDSAVFFRKVLA